MSDYEKKLEETPRILGMRDVFFEALHGIFKHDDRCVFVTADNGAPTLDPIANDFPSRFHQVGIAEAHMMGFAAGLALEGRKVWTYAIAPFVTERVFEQVKLDLCAMNLDVCCLGVGAGFAYDVMGPSHHMVTDLSIMRTLPNLTIWSPADPATAGRLARLTHETRGPQYVRLDRVGLEDIPGGAETSSGLRWWGFGEASHAGTTIVATGVTVHTALKVAERLARAGLSGRVVDVWRIKPLNAHDFKSALGAPRRIVTIEEHLLAGGLGSLVLETLSDAGVVARPVMRFGVPDALTFTYGGRDAIWEQYGLTVDAITREVLAAC